MTAKIQALQGIRVLDSSKVLAARMSTQALGVARRTFVTIDGVLQPAPAPCFRGTPAERPTPLQMPNAGVESALAAWGFEASDVTKLHKNGALPS